MQPALWLNQPLNSLPGMSEKKALLLSHETGIKTLLDLLEYYPYRYIDKTKIFTIAELKPDMLTAQVKGRILSFEIIGTKHKQRLTAKFADASGVMELVWFQGIKYVLPKLNTHQDFLIFGKPTWFNGKLNMAHPELEIFNAERQSKASTLHGLYSTTEKMKRAWLDSKAISKYIAQTLQLAAGEWVETLPVSWLETYQLLSRKTAYEQIHFPHSAQHLEQAIRRLKFDEMFFLQLQMARKKAFNKKKLKGIPFASVGHYFLDFYEKHLPFTLTNAQKRVVKEIRADLAKPSQMNRLLQGDVGSGKTVVALLSMLLALDNQCQCAMMAPTEILARQHYDTLKQLLGDMPVSLALLTGSVKGKERKAILHDLASGQLHILVGTHALIEDPVQFKQLGLAVIDEQHRFGVAQRAKLWAKNTMPPHVLVMSATPIPRTLAMTLYGDLDVSIIDELPPGRKPIKTIHRFEDKRWEVYDFIKAEIRKGFQAYIVYPLIEESETLDYQSLMDGFNQVLQVFFPPEFSVGMVHGQMKPQEKDAIMARFAKGQVQILLSTTVIEVGVNVPNASVMLIESAERFGLSQLHQLRGRVGRGAEQSYCILLTGFKLSLDSKKRIATMVETTDGFKIAEVDMEIRGPGDMQGTQQSGLVDFKITDLSKDQAIITFCRNKAIETIQKDPELILPEHLSLQQHLKFLNSIKQNWSMIS